MKKWVLLILVLFGLFFLFLLSIKAVKEIRMTSLDVTSPTCSLNSTNSTLKRAHTEQYINSFNVFFDNGLKIKANDILGEYSINLRAFVELKNGERTSFNLDSANIPFKKLTDTSYKYNITTSLPPNIAYLGLSFDNSPILDIQLENRNQSIRFCRIDTCIVFDFSDIPLAFTLNETELKINVSGMSSIHIDPTITFTTNDVEAVALSPLTQDFFAIAWCDDTSGYRRLQFYYANGTAATSVINVHPTAEGDCDYTSVSVSALNSTHVVIGWYDATYSDATFAIYNSAGTLITGPIDVDTDVGFSYSVSVSALNSTHFIIGWYDSTDQDATFAIYNSAGTLITGPIDADDVVSVGAYSVSVSALSSTQFVIGWYDANDYDATFAVYNSAGTLIAGPIDADTDIGAYSQSVSVSALSSTQFVIGWYDNTDLDATFAIYNSAGALIAGPIDVDTDVGTTSYSNPVSVSALNSTHFVIGWYDNTDLDATFAVYNSAGTLIAGPIDSSTDALRWQAVSSYLTAVDIGFCSQNFIHAFVISSIKANFITYKADGTSWNGICPETTPPTYSLNSTNSTYAGSAVSHNLKWADNVGLSYAIPSFDNCTGTLTNLTAISLSGASAWSNFTVVINSTVDCQIRWCVYANDTFNNWNGTSCISPFSYTTTSANIPPNLSDIWEFPTDPATYSSGATYRFNITACDANGASDLDKVLFQWSTNTNVTATSYVTHNATCRNYTITEIDLPAQTSTTYKWYVNDSYNEWANMLSDAYTISKAPTETHVLSNGTGDKTYDAESYANFTVYVNISGKTVKLDSNYTGWVLRSDVTPLINISYLIRTGTWNLTGYFGGDQNYSASSETHYFTVFPMKRSVTQQITPLTIVMKSVFKKIATQILNIQALVTRINAIIIRAITQPITLILSTIRRVVAYRISQITLTISIAISRLNVLISKQIIQSTTVSPILTEFEHISKTIIQSIQIPLILEKIGYVSRVMTQAIAILPILTRLGEYTFSTIQIITTSPVLTRLTYSFKAIIQSLSVSPILTKLTHYLEAITQSITVLPALTELEHILKTITQTIDISETISRLNAVVTKQIIQITNVQPILKRIGNIFRISPQTATIVPSLNVLRISNRISTLQISISTTISRLNIIISKQIIQALNIQATLTKIEKAIRASTQAVNAAPSLKVVRIPYLSPIMISITTTITRTIVAVKSFLLYLFVQPVSLSGYAHITETEGPYVPVKCSEWGTASNKCKASCPDCYSEINFVVPWVKSVTLNNTGDYTAYAPVNASIPKSTNSADDIKLYDPDSVLHTFTAHISDGYINWTTTIDSAEVQKWVIKFNTTSPSVSEYNETAGVAWTLWHNVSSADVDYEKVWDYAYLKDPSIYIRFYDNTTGLMDEFTGKSAWGPPVTKDLDGNGYSDFGQWMIPKISANTDKQLVIKSTIAKVSCEIENKTILNAPVLAWENVEWRWTIKCSNLIDITLSYSQNFRIPLESSRIYLDNNPTEPGFLIVPPYGPYVTLEGSIGPYENKTHVLEFLTSGVTTDIPPASFPSRFWTMELANLILDITAKSWSSETINETQTKINIVYGENVKLFKEGFLIDSIDEIKGYYTLKIYEMAPYESRSYMLSYMTPVADAKVERYSRRIINGSQYLVYPFSYWSLASFPVSPLWVRIKQESPFSCSDIYQVWETTVSDYLNPMKPQKILNFECEDKNTTLIELSSLTLGQTKYGTIFVTEVEKPMPFTDVLYNFFEWLANLIKNFISSIVSIFGGKR